MTGEEIIVKFQEKMSKIPKVDLSIKENYYAFCERLAEKVYPEMKRKDKLRAHSMALAHIKVFG